MASTVAKLVLQIEANARSVPAQMAAATRSVAAFASTIDKTFARVNSLKSLGAGPAAALTQGFDKAGATLKTTIADLNRQLKTGLSSEEFLKGSFAAIRQAKKESLDTVKALREMGVLTEKEAAAASRAAAASAKKAEQTLLPILKGGRDVAKLTQDIERSFNAAEASRTIGRALGQTTKKEFDQLGRENAAAWNLALGRRMSELSAAGKLTEPLRQQFSKLFKPEGFGVGASANPLEQQLQQAGRAVDVLERRFNQSAARLKGKLAKELISPEEFDREMFKLMKRFDQGLIASADRLAGPAAIGQAVAQGVTKPLQQAVATGNIVDKVLPTAAVALQRGSSVGSAIAGGVLRGVSAARQAVSGILPVVNDVARRGVAVGRALSGGIISTLGTVQRQLTNALTLPAELGRQGARVGQALISGMATSFRGVKREMDAAFSLPADLARRGLAAGRSLAQSIATPLASLKQRIAGALVIPVDLARQGAAIGRGLAQGLGTSLGPLKRRLTDAFTVPVEIARRGAELGRSLVSGFASQITGVKRRITDALAIPADVARKGVDIARSLATGFTTALEGVRRRITDTFAVPVDMARRGLDAGRSLVTGFASQLTGVKRRLADALAISADVVRRGGEIGQSIGTGLSAGLTGIKRRLSDALAVTTDVARRGLDMGRSFTAGLTTALAGVKRRVAESFPLATDMARRGLDIGQSMTAGMVAALGGLKQRVLTAFPAAGDMLERGSAIGRAISSGVATTITGLRSRITAALPAAADVAARGAGIGRALFSGIAGSLAPIRREISAALSLPADVARRGAEMGRSLLGGMATAFGTVRRRIVDAFPAVADIAQRGRTIGSALTTGLATAFGGVRQRLAAALPVVSDLAQRGRSLAGALAAGISGGLTAVRQNIQQALVPQQANLSAARQQGVLVAGAIAQGVQQGATAARASTAAAVASGLAPQAANLITSKLKLAGKRTVDEGVLAARQYVKGFRDTYNAAIGAAQLKKLTGTINTRQFEEESAKAAKAMVQGLRQATARLEAEGLLTPQAVAFINKQYKGLGDAVPKTFFEAFDKAMADSTVRSLSRLGTLATQIGGTMVKFLTLPIVGIGAATVKLAGDAQLAQGKLEQTFGPLALDLGRKLDGLRKTIPATSAELRGMASTLGELFLPLRLAPEKVAEMSVEMIKVAKNISVFRGVSTERAFNAVINGLIGQSRELKKLGITIDDRAIRDEAYRLGLARVGAQLSTTQKVLAGYSVLQHRAGIIQNTVADQQNTFNVRMLFFVARIKEAGIAIGTTLLPALTKLVEIVTGLAEAFGNLSPEMQKFIALFAGAIAVIGPFLLAIGALSRGIALYRAAMIALDTASLGATAAAGGGGLLAALGITAATIPGIGQVGVAIAGLSFLLSEYETSLGDFKGLSNEFVASLKTMTDAELRNILVIQHGNIQRIKAERDALQKQAGITIAPPAIGHLPNPFAGAITGGTNDQRDQFIRLGEELKKAEATWEATNTQLERATSEQAALNDRTRGWRENLEKIQAAESIKLLVEQLQEAKLALNDLKIRSAAARAEITKFGRAGDTRNMEEGITRAQTVIESLTQMNAEFNRLALVPENAPLKAQFTDIAIQAKTARDQLQAFLLTARGSKDIQTFTSRLAELRKALELGVRTGNIENVEEAFRSMADLQKEVQDKLAETMATAGDDPRAGRALLPLQTRLQSILTDLQLITVKFTGLVPVDLFRRVDQLTAKLREMKEQAPEGTLTSTGVPLEQTRAQRNEVFKLIQLQDELNRKIAESATAGFPTDLLDKKLAEVRKSIKENTPNLFDVLFGDEFIPKIEEVAGALRAANFSEQIAASFGDAGLAAAAELQKGFALGMKGQLFDNLKKQISGLAGVTDEQANIILQGFQKAFGQAVENAGNVSTSLSKVETRLRNISALTSGLRQLADVFGDADRRIGQMLESVGNLVEALIKTVQLQKEINQDIAKRQAQAAGAAKEGGADSAGQLAAAAKVGATATQIIDQVVAMIGIVGAAIGVLNSIANLFGKSALDKEHDEILKNNNARLAELNNTISGFSGSLGDQQRVQRQLRDPRVLSAINTGIFKNFVGNFGTIGQKQIDEINRQLSQFGITWEEINRIAKDNGIQLLDSKGRLVAGAFDQLAKAIELQRQASLKYADTLTDQQKKIDLFNNVFNVDPQNGRQVVQDQLKLLSQLAPDLFKQFFGGIDLSDTAATEKALQAFTQALLLGTLETSESLKLLDRGEIEQIIENMAGGFDTLREATDKLTESMLNVPDWFKTNQVRFESALPFEPPPPVTSTGTPVQGGVDNPKPPGGVRPVSNDVNISGDVNINIAQLAGESNEDLADRVVAALRRDKFMRTGTTRIPGIDD